MDFWFINNRFDNSKIYLMGPRFFLCCTHIYCTFVMLTNT